MSQGSAPPPPPLWPHDALFEHLSRQTIRRMDTIDNLAFSGIRTLTIINGGAIVAIFAMLAQGGASSFVQQVHIDRLIGAAAMFAGGLVAILVANLLGYIGQQILIAHEQTEFLRRFELIVGAKARASDDRWRKLGNVVVWAAAAPAVLSLVLFAVGCAKAVAAAPAISGLKAAAAVTHQQQPARLSP